MGRPDPWSLLRRATVRLVDPADPARWGTGFFVARDVLLTCWHVVREGMAEREGTAPHLRVEWPGEDQGAEGSLSEWPLGEATLLEAGTPWDLALLRVTPSREGAAAGQAGGIDPGALPVVPLRLQDPPPGARLFTTAFPEDADGRHGATYEAVGRTTPKGHTTEFLRFKGDGVVPGFSGSALLDLESGGVCGVIARNELPGGSSDGGLAVPLAIFREAFPAQGEEVLRRNALERHPSFTAAPQRLGRPDWSWPAPLDSAHHRAEKREGFVGRDWLFAEVRAWARGGPERALLITADFGVGKSAFLAELVDRSLEGHGAGIPIAAHHFCDHATNATLAPGEFVTSVASQLAQALPAYRAALEADDAERLRARLNEANRDPSSAWDQAVVAPLARIPPPAGPLLLVVDALDEALEHRPDTAAAATLTIVDLLARHTPRLPAWLRVLATSRDREEVRGPLGQAFQPRHLDPERAANLDDLQAYALGRCRQGELAERLAAAHLRPEPLAAKLRELSGGKFLYAVRVLNELATGALPLGGPTDLAHLPAGLEAFYRDTFQRRFPPTQKEAYGLARPLLALLCAQREPLAIGSLAALTGQSQAEVEAALEPVDNLLRRRPVPAAEGQDWTLRLDHFSLEQWLSERNERGRWKAGAFAVDREAAAARLRGWALAEVEANRTHHWPYLVRHLASHLTGEERPRVIAGLLGEFAWLEARLRLVGINALLGDCAVAAPSPGLGRLERALRQGAHVLSHNEGWSGLDQLASQLLARLADDGGSPESKRLRAEAVAWLQQTGGACPRAASLVAQDSLLRTLPVGSAVGALVTLPDGRLASGCGDGTIRLWDPATGACSAVFEGHQGGVNALAVLGDGRLASGSDDNTIRLWDPATGSCSAVFEGHQGGVRALAVLGDGRLASGSSDNTIRLWDPATGSCSAVFEGHQGGVNALAVLGDGRLASAGSWDKTIRLWDPASGACSAVFEGHQGGVRALAVLGDGRLASGSFDTTIRLWDPASGACSAVFEGHQYGVYALAVLGDGRLASGSDDTTIRLWDPATGACSAVFEGNQDWVRALAVLGDGRLASGSDDTTIRLWDPATGSCSAVFEGHQYGVYALAVLGDGRLASGSDDKTIRLWDPATGACSAVFEGHRRGVNALAVLGDGRLASGSDDTTIRLWDPAHPDGAPRVLFVADAAITALVAHPTRPLLVAGDTSGRLHWLELPRLR